MNIGLLTASVSRNGAGVAQAVRDLALALDALPGLSIRVFGLEDENTHEDRPGWRTVPISTHPIFGPRSIGLAPKLIPALLASPAELLHLHGIWMYPSFACLRWSRRRRRPHVVSPHGMLDPWALRRSPWKKRIANCLFERANLSSAECLHALSDAEARAIRAAGFRNPICVIPNGVDLPGDPDTPEPSWSPTLPNGTPVLLYLGRLHPKKGLLNLLRAWQAASRRTSASNGWHLVIAGWDQDHHLDRLQQFVQAAGISGTVRFVGPQFGPDKTSAYRGAQALILPSLSEGLPVTVLEAWAHKLPVLMTKHCNLPEGFESRAAIEIDPEPISIGNALTALFQTSEAERAQMGLRGLRLVERCFAWPVIAAQMAAVYRWVLASGPKPDCVLNDL